VSSRLFDEGIVAKLFTDIAIRMKERPGGYTRILKLGERYGDAAEEVILELVDYKLDVDGSDSKAKKEKKPADAKKDDGKKGASKKGARPRGVKKAATA
jgi:large subunit ribosomal protein L17